ncbi:hypothetical protein HMPREF0762_01586 [Slackia exigua ATCC 700122]|uniref:Uncharacterized protein n=1 Tax=Slackia exigua (strain ATCC 700122 / DSM 15923 / CIP 105133 / JCM 11022 / KCTC 5966 / S-7) TaxID=649764 RepID=D0WIB2_SLAES|nr:hypothetical protein HMPREF0762_01586 [Slackia exigua ATCC 700122]
MPGFFRSLRKALGMASRRGGMALERTRVRSSSDDILKNLKLQG